MTASKLTQADRRLIVAALAIAANSRDDAAKRVKAYGLASHFELTEQAEAFRRVLAKVQSGAAV